MITVDLITGFLGSGKTTFIRKYARYLMDKGLNIGILENDFGAVNVDMMLLKELEGDNCELEMVAGGCDKDCYRRRFRTKLIAMGMSGYDRVLIEPSGVFDVDDFFDALHDEPLDRWYQIGNVIAVVDAGLEDELSDEADYVLASEAANAGCIVFSRTNLVTKDKANNTVQHINRALEKIHCNRKISDEVITVAWEAFGEKEFEKILNSGYKMSDYEKRYGIEDGFFKSLYFMDEGIGAENIKKKVNQIFNDSECGNVFRIKGFIKDGDGWIEMNATSHECRLKPIKEGQDVLIVIGSDLNEDRIRSYIK